MMKLAKKELWLCLKTAPMMEWKSLQLSDTLLRFQFGQAFSPQLHKLNTHDAHN